MSATQKVTANLSADALKRAQNQTGKGVTATLTLALGALEDRAKQAALRRLRGKVKFVLDLAAVRRTTRRS